MLCVFRICCWVIRSHNTLLGVTRRCTLAPGCCTYCCLVLINKSTFVHQSTGSRWDIYKPAGTVRCLDRRIARSRQVLASRRQLQRRRRTVAHAVRPAGSAFDDRPAAPCNYLHSHRRLDFPLPYRYRRPTPPRGRYLVMQFTYRADGVSVWSRICCWCWQRDPPSETETEIETSLTYTVRRSYCVKFRLAVSYAPLHNYTATSKVETHWTRRWQEYWIIPTW